MPLDEEQIKYAYRFQPAIVAYRDLFADPFAKVANARRDLLRVVTPRDGL
jgi:hypothetical protein